MTPERGRIADGTTRDALAWLDTVGDKPFFPFVHYFDSAPPVNSTYLGESLEIPETIPFALKGTRPRARSTGRPGNRLEPPYVLVWYEESRYKGDTSIKLDEEPKKELRALGYIQ